MMKKNIIYNKCYSAICRESLVTCLTGMKMMKKMCTLKFDMNKYASLENNIQEKAKSQKPTLIYAKAAMYNCNKNDVFVVTDICRNMYIKCTTK